MLFLVVLHCVLAAYLYSFVCDGCLFACLLADVDSANWLLAVAADGWLCSVVAGVVSWMMCRFILFN